MMTLLRFRHHLRVTTSSFRAKKVCPEQRKRNRLYLILHLCSAQTLRRHMVNVTRRRTSHSRSIQGRTTTWIFFSFGGRHIASAMWSKNDRVSDQADTKPRV